MMCLFLLRFNNLVQYMCVYLLLGIKLIINGHQSIILFAVLVIFVNTVFFPNIN